MEEEIKFQGHENILSLHPRTIEITKGSTLTKSGDCIVGVSANKGCDDLDSILKRKLRKVETLVRIIFIVEPHEFRLSGFGHADLELSHKHDIVLRKSNFVDSRTLAVSCDKSALDIPRDLIKTLTNSRKGGILRISLE